MQAPQLEAPRILPRDIPANDLEARGSAFYDVREAPRQAIAPLDLHSADACTAKLQELQRQAQQEQQQLHLRLQQMRGQELYQQLQQEQHANTLDISDSQSFYPMPNHFDGSFMSLGLPPADMSGYPRPELGAYPPPELGMYPQHHQHPMQPPQQPSYFGLQPVQLPQMHLSMPNLQPVQMPQLPAMSSSHPSIPPSLAPKALAPPLGIARPHLEVAPIWMPGSQSLASGDKEAWAGEPRYPVTSSASSSTTGMPLEPVAGKPIEPVTNVPVEPVSSLTHLAGVSAKQDKDILDTLQSSGLALNLKRLDEPEVDISQMLNMSMSASQGSASIPSQDRMGTPSTARPEASQVPSFRPQRELERRLPEVLKSGPIMAAEDYLRSYRPQKHVRSLVYPGGANVDFTELAPVMKVVAIANSQSRPRMLQALESGSHVRTALQVFRESDRDGCGFLTWSNGGIRDFVMNVFIQLGLVPPAEMQTYAAHTLFDVNRSMCLSACDCLCLVDTLLRAVLLDDSEIPQTEVMEPRAVEPRAVRGKTSPSRTSHAPGSVAEELKEAQAETERLRQELEELKAAEAEAGQEAPEDSQEVLPEVPQGAAQGPSDTAALVWTAKAHAENRRLERELQSLRALANRQRGEVQWLHELKKQLNTNCRQEELEREHQKLMEMQQKEDHWREEAAVEEEAALQRERALEQRRERRLEERQERRKRIEERERQLREQELAQDLEQERLVRKEQDLRQRETHLQQERETRLQQAEALRSRELDFSRDMGRLRSRQVFSPSAGSEHVEPEEEADADSAEVAALAAAQSLENRKLRRELESLRALAQWQQSEVGAAIACKSAASADLPRPSKASPPPPHGHGALAMAALAAETLAEGAPPEAEAREWGAFAEARDQCDVCRSSLALGATFCHRCGHRQGPGSRASPGENISQDSVQSRPSVIRGGIEEYDRTVRDLMSRVLGRSDGLETPGGSPQRVIEPVTMQ
ncbi:unnamed protein product [Effrenium voratum]|uniref:Uncharacterized protein n=1 Tax=Effrenium voratum TaxID=2562239 RepID=A0AA36MSC2_9DINO|nr:unnamed protein product [Effrenium voratum]